MVGTYCCVPGCSSTTNKSKEKTSWHLFPANKEIKEEWIRRINRRTENGTLWEPNYFHRICGKHFNKSGKKESHNKYPIYFPNHTISDDTCRCFRQVNIFEDFELGENVQIGKQEVNIDSVNNIKESSSHHEHTYAKSGDNLDELEANKVTINNLETKIQFLIHENQSKDKELMKFASEINVLKSKCKHLEKHKIETNLIRRLKNDDNLLRFYTGFANITQFNIFIDFIKPGYDLARKMTFKNVDRYPSANLSLNLEKQLVLVLIRMRLALLEQDLAYRFCISTSTVSRIWSFWVDLLYSQLVNKYMGDTRVIWDCTEVFIEVPLDFGVQSRNAEKGLVGISKNGFISFVSDLYPDRTTDNQIFKECGLLENLESDDGVMGRNIEEILKEKNIKLLRKKYVDKEEVEETREIAKLRVHVERVYRHVKTFKILKNMYNNRMHDKLNQIWHVCCLLLNFVNESLLDTV